ncbi:hypothetical protein ES705_11992 [subsurface metagenome]
MSISETELPDKPFVLQKSPTNLKEKIALPAPIILSFIPDIKFLQFALNL